MDHITQLFDSIIEIMLKFVQSLIWFKYDAMLKIVILFVNSLSFIYIYQFWIWAHIYCKMVLISMKKYFARLDTITGLICGTDETGKQIT